MSEWQPIETAPKDGTRVDIYLGNAEDPCRVTDVEYREATDREYWVHGDCDGGLGVEKEWFDVFGWPYIESEAPTHWMPIPKPPSA